MIPITESTSSLWLKNLLLKTVSYWSFDIRGENEVWKDTCKEIMHQNFNSDTNSVRNKKLRLLQGFDMKYIGCVGVGVDYRELQTKSKDA